MTDQEIIDFLYNPENVLNCSECPLNHDFDDWEGKKPCGQQNCWVQVHVERATA